MVHQDGEDGSQEEADEGDADRARQQVGNKPYHQFESDGIIQLVSKSTSWRCSGMTRHVRDDRENVDEDDASLTNLSSMH